MIAFLGSTPDCHNEYYCQDCKGYFSLRLEDEDGEPNFYEGLIFCPYCGKQDTED